jgi:hypothetical protein
MPGFDPYTGQLTAGDVLGVQPAVVTEASKIPAVVLAGGRVPMLSPDGQPVFVSREELPGALQAGYVYEAPQQERERKLQSKYGEGVSNELLAAGAGAARGLTFGLSDVVGSQLGAGEALKELKERNPIASGVGEVGGTVASVFIPGGVGGLVAKGAARATAPLAKTIVGQVGAKAAAAAAEGAAYGISQTISEQALGSPDDLAENLIANMGVGALFGGAFSLGASGVEAAGKAGYNKIAKIFAKGTGAEDDRTIIERLMNSQRGMTKNTAAKVQQAAAELNAADALHPEMTSGSAMVQNLRSSIEQQPSPFGAILQEETNVLHRALQKPSKQLLSQATDLTERQVGEQVRDGIIKKIQADYDPIQQLYASLDPSRETIDLVAKSQKRVAQNIAKLSEQYGRAGGGPLAERAAYYAEAVQAQKNVRQLGNLISEINDEATAAYRAGNGGLGTMLRDIKDKMRRLEDSTILRAAIAAEQDGAEFGAAIGRDIVRDFRKARSGYRQFMEMLRDVADEGSFGKVVSPKVFMDKLADTDANLITRKLFQPKRVESVEFFRANFPEQFEKLRLLELAKIKAATQIEHRTYGEIIDLPKLARVLDRYQPEVQAAIFGPQGVKTVRNVKTIVDAMPGKFNPSETATHQAFQGILNPLFQVQEAGRFALLRGLPTVQKAGQKNIDFIDKATKAFLTGKGPESVRAALDVTVLNLNRDDHQPRLDALRQLSAQPELFVQNLQKSTEGLQKLDPMTNQAVANLAMQAVQFLQSKAPKPPAQEMFGKRPFRPSDAELARFNRYVQAVENPVVVLADLQKGILTKEQVEAIRVVYPGLYRVMVERITDHVSKHPEQLTYAQKLQLGTLLGVPVTTSADRAYIAALQKSAQAAAASAAEPGPGKAGPNNPQLKNFKVASNQTEIERVMGRHP